MKHFAKLLVLGAALVAAAPAALAVPITGTISVAGNDTYNATSITFNPTTGSVTSATGSMSIFAPVTLPSGLMASYTANLTSFSFANSNGVQLFSVSPAVAPTLTFTINGPLTAAVIDPITGALSIKGNGTFTETGFDATSGSFSLTSSSSGQITGFQLVSSVAATPEPSSLVMLGTGLVSAAGMLVRRRRVV